MKKNILRPCSQGLPTYTEPVDSEFNQVRPSPNYGNRLSTDPVVTDTNIIKPSPNYDQPNDYNPSTYIPPKKQSANEIKSFY